MFEGPFLKLVSYRIISGYYNLGLIFPFFDIIYISCDILFTSVIAEIREHTDIRESSVAGIMTQIPIII